MSRQAHWYGIAIALAFAGSPLSAQGSPLHFRAAFGVETLDARAAGLPRLGVTAELGLEHATPSNPWTWRLGLITMQRDRPVLPTPGGCPNTGCVRAANSRIYGLTPALTYHLGAPTAKLRPYALAGAGAYWTATQFKVIPVCPQDHVCAANLAFRYHTSSIVALGASAGLGLSLNIGHARAFIETTYTQFSTSRAEHHILPLTLGIRL